MKHLRNRSKTTKNPDENPDLPMVSKNLKKISANQNFCQMFVISKKKARERNS
jgi:hypothetical protein